MVHALSNNNDFLAVSSHEGVVDIVGLSPCKDVILQLWNKVLEMQSLICDTWSGWQTYFHGEVIFVLTNKCRNVHRRATRVRNMIMLAWVGKR